MSKFAVAIVLSALITGSLFADGFSATDPASYDVVRTNSPPTIDGIISPGEWSSASPAADRWVNLRADTPDTHELNFQMMWDDEFLYILGQNDYDNFVEGRETEDHAFAPFNPDFGGGGYALNLYFDPNTDEEELWPDLDLPFEERPTTSAHPSVDGYQISWDLHLGHAERRPTEGLPDQPLRNPLDADGNPVNDYFGGFFIEAHANDAFGDQGAPGSSWAKLGDGPNQNLSLIHI